MVRTIATLAIGAVGGYLFYLLGIPLPWMLAAQALGTALVIYGFWVEPHRVGQTRQTLTTDKLRTRQPLRLLHLGDLHAEIGETERERQTLAHVRASAADVIVFSGDFLNLSYLEDRRAWAVARNFLKELSAPLGVFAVSGSPACVARTMAASVAFTPRASAR